MNHFQKYLAEEFAEEYEEGRLTRRDALKLIASVTGSLLIANTILAACAAPPEETPAAAPTEAPTAEATSPAAAPTETAAQATAPATAPGEVPTATTATGAQPTEAAAPTGEIPGTGATPAYGTVSPDDPAVQGSDVQFEGEGAQIMGYLARPAGEGPFAVVLVCHENRGLTEHIKDVTRRLAKAGYVGLAVDLLSREGGSAAVGTEGAPGVLSNIPPDQYVQDFLSGWEYLKEQPYAEAERVGMVGFCYGGGVTWLMATRMPELKAAVPFYGPHPPLEDVSNIQAPIRAIYGGNDQRINAGIPEIEAAMLQNNKIFEKIIYPNADHAFHNDTGQRYNPEAAQDAWGKTLEWFGQYL